MKNLKIYRPRDIENLISKRKGEVKFGERIGFIEDLETLGSNPAKFVLIGIPEDIGVRANQGVGGASKAWHSFLKSLLNVQHNRFNRSENLLLLGEINCDELNKKASHIDKSDPNYHVKLGDLVKEIDIMLAEVIEKIISSGKTPIIIGGGHNNAYGNIKGAAMAWHKPLNVMNIDAHTDLRQLEHRHSGNGFSYAIKGEYLSNYTVFGLQQNYTPEYIYQEMDLSKNIHYYHVEDLLQNPLELIDRFKEALIEINTDPFGLELDCDVIADFPSSAQSPVGFSLIQVRNFIKLAAKEPNCTYLHICEAAPTKDTQKMVGKALSYLVTDFIH